MSANVDNPFMKINALAALYNMKQNTNKKRRVAAMPENMRVQWEKMFGSPPSDYKICPHVRLSQLKIEGVVAINNNEILCKDCQHKAKKTLLPVSVGMIQNELNQSKI